MGETLGSGRDLGVEAYTVYRDLICRRENPENHHPADHLADFRDDCDEASQHNSHPRTHYTCMVNNTDY